MQETRQRSAGWIFLVTLLAARGAVGDTRVVLRPAPDAHLRLELPLLDLPFNQVDGFTFPSMEQSTAITTGFYELAHHGLRQIWNPQAEKPLEAAVGMTLLSAFDTITFFVAGPLGSAWNHEEWHRAALSRRQGTSRNPLSTGFGLPLLRPVAIEIDAADDARIKAEFPADYAHVAIAGFASHYALALAFEKNAFFHDQPTVSSFIIGMNYLLPVVYHAQCLQDLAEGDCSLQVKHLFAPAEPPSARALTVDERAYVRLQLGLSLLNLLDPFLFTIRAFETSTQEGEDFRWAVAVRAVPTPFGQDIRLDLFARRRGVGWFVSLHNAFNRESYFPGIDLERISSLVPGVDVVLRAGVWTQPRDQRFLSATHRAGGRAGLRLAYSLLGSPLSPYAEIEGKTEGWVSGNPFLETNLTARAGLVLRL